MKGEAKNWWKGGKSDLETARYNFVGNKLSAAAFFANRPWKKR